MVAPPCATAAENAADSELYATADVPSAEAILQMGGFSQMMAVPSPAAPMSGRPDTDRVLLKKADRSPKDVAASAPVANCWPAASMPEAA